MSGRPKPDLVLSDEERIQLTDGCVGERQRRRFAFGDAERQALKDDELRVDF